MEQELETEPLKHHVDLIIFKPQKIVVDVGFSFKAETDTPTSKDILQILQPSKFEYLSSIGKSEEFKKEKKMKKKVKEFFENRKSYSKLNYDIWRNLFQTYASTEHSNVVAELCPTFFTPLLAAAFQGYRYYGLEENRRIHTGISIINEGPP
jgi:hypothetical protein